LAAKRQEALRSEQRSMSEALSHRARDEVFAIARKALGDLATTSLEERMGKVFIRRLRAMDATANAALGEALKTASEPALVRSVFELPADQRAAIQKAINETFSTDIPLHFATTPEVVCGIELSTNGQKVGWSIADYLVSLEKSVDELLKGKDKAEPQSELRKKIGKRAYEIYEQQGRKEGGAIQDWDKAESEVRNEDPSSARSEPSPTAKSKSKPKPAEPEPAIGRP
jgi:F-type H+-transporting ATPase subunit b